MPLDPFYFISYARIGGGSFALRLRNVLEEAGVETWIDADCIPPGARWSSFAIDEALNKTHGVLVVLTADALVSHQVESEWHRALNRDRLIIPLRVESIEVPRELALFNYIDFVDGDFKEHFRTLIQRLRAGIDSHINSLKKRRDVYMVLQKKKPHYQHKINDLNDAILSYGDGVEDQLNRINAWKTERLKASPPLERTGRAQVKIVGRPPRGSAAFFRDRLEERSRLGRLLADPNTRLISIVGRGGMGKTEIALKILDDLKQGRWPHTDDEQPIDGIIFLSQRNVPISLERLFLDITTLMDEEREAAIRQIWLSANHTTEDKIDLLLEGLGSGLYILFLDNVEALLNDKGHFERSGLQLFFEQLLTTHHNALVLITSRELIALKNPTGRIISLKRGLPDKEAVQLIRDQDPDGEYSIRNLPEMELTRLATLVHGVPHALKVAAGILIDNPEESIDDLVEQFFNREAVVDEVIEEGYKRLDDEARRYLEALSVFGRAVPNVAVDYLLEPFFPGLNTPLIRRRLARMNLVSIERGSDQVLLHQIESDFSYSQLPDEGPYSKKELELRAADFYQVQSTPLEDWHSLYDLEPFIFQFEHLMKAEAYEQAGRLLGSCSIWLSWRGHSAQTLAMHQQLDSKIEDPALEAVLVRGLANVYTVRGPLDEAIALYKNVINWVKASGPASVLGDLYLDMGVAYRYDGKLDLAREVFQKSLEIYQETPGDYDYSQALHQLARICVYQGNTREGMEYAEEALRRDSELERPLFQGIAHSIIAMANLAMEHYDAAIEHGGKAHSLLVETGSKDTVGWVVNTLGLAYLAKDELGDAIKHFKFARVRGKEDEQPRLEGFALINLAWTQFQGRNLNQATATVQKAIQTLEVMHLHEAQAARALRDAITASADQNTQVEISSLLVCAEAIATNPDIHAGTKIASFARGLADERGLSALAAEAEHRIAELNDRRTY